MPLPVLDPLPPFKPHDYSFRKIYSAIVAGVPGVEKVERTRSYRNPFINLVAEADQDFRGTCTGQSVRIWADLNLMELANQLPTPEEMSKFKKDDIDPFGTRRDILFCNSFSAECAYQMGRYVGNITYPSGGEIRFCARAYRDYGMCLESHWHTDKSGTAVWAYPPGPRGPAAGGATPEFAFRFAKDHVIDGWAMVGREDGDATWDEICDAIFLKHKILCGIPIYDNYREMAGGDGTYPTPKGPIVGYHAQCVFGYTPDYLDVEHSWGSWCGRHGKITKEYFNIAKDQCVWMVMLDEKEAAIGHALYTTIDILCNVPATVSIGSIPVGLTPLTITVDAKKILVTVSAEGYVSQSREVDESSGNQLFVLDASPVSKTLWQRFIIWLTNLLKRK